MTEQHGFAITSTYDGDSCCLALTGDVDVATSEALLTLATERLRENGVQVLVVELSGVSFLDSSGLRSLFAVAVLAQQLEKRFMLRSPSRKVRHVIEVSRLDTLITVTG